MTVFLKLKAKPKHPRAGVGTALIVKEVVKGCEVAFQAFGQIKAIANAQHAALYPLPAGGYVVLGEYIGVAPLIGSLCKDTAKERVVEKGTGAEDLSVKVRVDAVFAQANPVAASQPKTGTGIGQI